MQLHSLFVCANYIVNLYFISIELFSKQKNSFKQR